MSFEMPGYKEAVNYNKLEGNRVQCYVCPRRCVIGDDKAGYCGVRKNIEGTLILEVYGKLASSAIDPIEKKPFYNFAPGSKAFSMCTYGCNLGCDFCQNYKLSMGNVTEAGRSLMPLGVAKEARNSGCDGIAYTYTEPTIFLEYAFETMVEAETDLYNVFVSNGYMTQETIEMVTQHLDAINIDIKGDETFYREYCDVPDHSAIFDTLKEMKRHDIHVEVTNLIIPGENDERYQIRHLCQWVKENLGRETPIHFSGFRPAFRFKDRKPTPMQTLEKAMDIAKEEDMFYVYGGNLLDESKQSTYCPHCGVVAIKRRGFKVISFNLDSDMRCENCGNELHIRGKNWIPEKYYLK